MQVWDRRGPQNAVCICLFFFCGDLMMEELPLSSTTVWAMYACTVCVTSCLVWGYASLGILSRRLIERGTPICQFANLPICPTPHQLTTHTDRYRRLKHACNFMQFWAASTAHHEPFIDTDRVGYPLASYMYPLTTVPLLPLTQRLAVWQQPRPMSPCPCTSC